MNRMTRNLMLAAIIPALSAAIAAGQTTAPAEMDWPEPPGPLEPMEIAEDDLDAALAPLSEDEQLLAADVADESRQFREPFLYVLLRRAAMMPAGPESLKAVDPVRYDNLLSRPANYRGRPIGMEVWVWSIQPLEGLSLSRWWGDRPAWWAICSLRDVNDATSKPIVVILTELPEGLSEGRYHDNQPVRIACGLFYKTIYWRQREIQPGDPSEILYPVMVAGALLPPDAQYRSEGLPGYVLAMFAAVVVMAAGYVVLKTRTRRSPASGPAPAVTIDQPDENEDGDVDPDLVEQVRRYRQQEEEH